MSIEEIKRLDEHIERCKGKGNLYNRNNHIMLDELTETLTKQLEKKQKEEQDKITKPKVRKKSFGKEQH